MHWLAPLSSVLIEREKLMATFSPTESIASMQAQLAAQQGKWTAFGNTIFENVVSLVDLNLGLAKDCTEESTMVTQQMLSAKSPQDVLMLSAGKGLVHFERIISYWRDVAAVASNIQAELSKAAATQI